MSHFSSPRPQKPSLIQQTLVVFETIFWLVAPVVVFGFVGKMFQENNPRDYQDAVAAGCVLGLIPGFILACLSAVWGGLVFTPMLMPLIQKL